MDIIRFRIPTDLKRNLRAQLALEGVNLTDFFINAAKNYLEKNTNILIEKTTKKRRIYVNRDSGR